MLKKKTSYDVFVLLLTLYMLTNMLYTLFPTAISPNRVVGVAIIIVVSYIYLKDLTKKDLILIFYLGIVSVYTQWICTDIYTNFEHIQYFVVTILLLWKVENRKFREEVYCAVVKNRKIITLTIYIILAAVTIGFRVPSCYTYGYTGFAVGAHPFLSGVTLVFAYYILVNYRNYFKIKDIFVVAILLGAVFIGAARTYLISIGLLALIYYLSKFKNTKIKYIVLICVAFALVYIIPSTTIIERFSSSSLQGVYNGQTEIEAMSSGRFVFWKLDLQAFLDLDILKKIFGAGFDYIYTYNQKNYGVRIWAHNDFIHLLNSIGIVGLLVYVFVVFRVLWTMFKEIKNKKNKLFFSKLILTSYILVIAFINGLYIYQHYFYSCIIVLCIFTIDDNERFANYIRK